MKEGGRRESVLEYERNWNGIAVCKLAEGWMVMVRIVRCCRELKKKKTIVVLRILINLTGRN